MLLLTMRVMTIQIIAVFHLPHHPPPGNTMVFYPTLTNFWIVLILKSSKDVALIR